MTGGNVRFMDSRVVRLQDAPLVKSNIEKSRAKYS